MRQELREALFVALLIVPVAIVANGLGFIFLLALEHTDSLVVWSIGTLAVPVFVGAGTYGLALWNRPRAARLRTALFVRPAAIYLFVVAVAGWLWNFRSGDAGMIAPFATASVTAWLAGLGVVVWRARPPRETRRLV